jgi:hypothetical protein
MDKYRTDNDIFRQDIPGYPRYEFSFCPQAFDTPNFRNPCVQIIKWDYLSTVEDMELLVCGWKIKRIHIKK